MFTRQTKLTWPLLLGLVVLISTTSVWPQTTGTLLGTITDETGAVLPGVTIQINNQDTGLTRTAISNDTGRYNAPNLALGVYQVSAELPGFKTSTLSEIHLTVGAQITANMVLQIG
ncbi:MAG: carboxypeptidase-like regulatory domain-containing protein, partial [Acidobacteria bacterium]|nr:carboxypeptidase-like regulatory domain-containing protein [Acidobacteriota bacterium]